MTVLSHSEIFEAKLNLEFGNDAIVFEMVKKKMFDFMCHMMG